MRKKLKTASWVGTAIAVPFSFLLPHCEVHTLIEILTPIVGLISLIGIIYTLND